MNKTISPKIIALTFGILAVSFLAAFYVVAWTEPSQAPPAGNVAPPLNVSNVGQSKEGGLILNTGGAVNGLIVDKGNVGIGTVSPQGILDVVGSSSYICAPGHTDNGDGTCSATFYPDGAVDGYITYQPSDAGLPWSSLVSSGGGTDVYCCPWNGGQSGFDASFTTANYWRFLDRGFFLFDTSSIPDNAVIASANLSLYGIGKYDDLSVTPDINIYSSTPTSNISLVVSDFGKVGSTAFSTAITYSAWAINVYNNFSLNSNGIANISKTGVSKFSARNANYDVANIAPPWIITKGSEIIFGTTESGAGKKPKLVVTYRAAGPSSLMITSSGSVGVGTASPTQKLDVAGYIKGQNGLCIGDDCRNAWPSATGGSGDITGVYAGTGLTGGGDAGEVTMNLGTTVKGTVDQGSPYNLGPAVNIFNDGWATCPVGQYVCGVGLRTINGATFVRVQCCGK